MFQALASEIEPDLGWRTGTEWGRMQVLVDGLLRGVLLGTIGVAFALVYQTTRVFHVALGGLYAITPFLVLAFVAAGVPFWLCIVLTLLAVAALGAAIEAGVHWPLVRKSAPAEVHLIASLGTYLVLVQFISIAWGSDTRVLRQATGDSTSVGMVTLASAQIAGTGVALLAVIALSIWLAASRHGLELRALADNPVLVGVLGRNVRQIRRRVFGLSAALAGIAAMGQAWDLGFNPSIGLEAVLLGMVAMIIGGSASFLGPFCGGLLLGVLRGWVSWIGASRWEDAVTFALLAGFLLVRPRGLFARRMRIEEAG